MDILAQVATECVSDAKYISDAIIMGLFIIGGTIAVVAFFKYVL